MNVNKACDELSSKKYYKILINIEVIVYATYHLKWYLVILTWNLFSRAISSFILFYFS